jgi:hypothetical protein
MAQIRSRDEALAAVERALGGWLQNAAGVMTQAAATADAAQSVAAAEVRRWANTEAALRQLLAAAKDEETARPLRQKLNRALACHQTALKRRRRWLRSRVGLQFFDASTPSRLTPW